MGRTRKLQIAVFLAAAFLLTFGFLTAPAAYAAEDGVIMALEFDEGAPKNPKVETAALKDTSGKNNNGTLRNPKAKDDTEYPTIKYTDGKFGQALRLNGAQQYFDVGKSVFNHDAVTIAFWVNYRGGANWQRFFEMGTGETGEHMMIVPSTDAGKFQISGYNKI